MNNFNPFGKPIQRITGTDLHILRNVHEDWYIDYKRKSLSIEKYGKHISSFANQYGGWIFIGIKELELKDSNEKGMVAGDFCGIPSDEVPKTLLQIRESISRYVNPDVYYETKIINGPNNKIGLAKGKSIIIIGIPQGVNPPYIHKTGKIYKRIADQSDPKAETDRFILDDLWKRGIKQKEKLEKFVLNVPKLSDNEKNNPYIYLYFLTNPLFEKIDY
jgi:predicted HTH transcriptional regulator